MNDPWIVVVFILAISLFISIIGLVISIFGWKKVYKREKIRQEHIIKRERLFLRESQEWYS